MNKDEMLKRTRQFAIRVVKMVAALPQGSMNYVIGTQVLKSGTSIGANYREALRASSRRHFITSMEIAEREAAETVYWLDILVASGIVMPQRLTALQEECEQLLAIITASGRTAKRRLRQNPKSEIRNPKSTTP